MTPELADVVETELERILGLLNHASFHAMRKNLGAVDEAIIDAVKRLNALLAQVREGT